MLINTLDGIQLLCNYFNAMSDEDTMGLPGVGGAEDVAALLGEISAVLGDEHPVHAISDDNAFELPSSEVLNLLPKHYLREDENSDHVGESVVLVLDNLYEQLARGKVEVTVSDLAYHLPMNIIYQAALDDKSNVELSLPTVVSSVGLNKLISHTPPLKKVHGVEGMDDIFRAADATPYSGADEDDDSPVVFMDDAEPETEEQEEDRGQGAGDPASSEDFAEASSKEEKKKEEKPAPVAEPQEWPDSFNYPALSIIKLLPPTWIRENAEEIVGDSEVTITMFDLFDQLKKGRILASGNLLAVQLPPEVLTDEVPNDDPPEVELDLQRIVESIHIDVLKGNAVVPSQDYDIDWMADPFEKPDVLPKLVRKTKPSKTTEVPTAVRPVEELEQKEVPYEKTDEDGPESEYHELPGNVNLNDATVDELMQLDGVTSVIAGAIMKFREEHKGFKTIFQLHRISAVDDDAFKKMTGMKAERKRFHRRRRLVNLLKIPAKNVSNLHRVAVAMVEKPIFAAEIISDREGLVLAQAGLGDSGHDFSAILPRVTKQIQHNMDLADAGSLGSVTLQMDGSYFTFISLSNVILTVKHEENQITRHGLELAQKVAEELEWLLSVRAFVGPRI